MPGCRSCLSRSEPSSLPSSSFSRCSLHRAAFVALRLSWVLLSSPLSPSLSTCLHSLLQIWGEIRRIVKACFGPEESTGSGCAAIDLGLVAPPCRPLLHSLIHFFLIQLSAQAELEADCGGEELDLQQIISSSCFDMKEIDLESAVHASIHLFL